MASYPTTAKIFSTKVDGVDLVQAAHINEIQDEVKAVEDQLITSKLATLSAAPVGNKVLTSVAGVPAWEERDGWIPVTGTFSYASASTINVSSGAAAVYAIGDRLKWVTATGSTQRYGTVVAVANTLLTIAVNTDHPLVNEAWTLPYYSHEASPVGYPGKFAYEPTITWTAGTAPTNPSTSSIYFSIDGRKVTLNVFENGYTGGATVTACNIPLPVPASPSLQPAYGYFNATGMPVAAAAHTNGANGTVTCPSVSATRLAFSATYFI